MLRSLYFRHVKRLLPNRIHGLLNRFAVYLSGRRRERLRKIILSYYNSHIPVSGMEHSIEFLKNNRFCFVPQVWTKEYLSMPVRVFKENGFRYVILDDGQKLFFKRDMDNFAIKKLLRELMMEQDSRSPHFYVRHEGGGIVVDCGAAEGLYGLLSVQKCEHLYLFESNADWVLPLEMTFRRYSHKVTIVNKYVGATDGDKSVSLDGFFAGKEIASLKADLEGAEQQMLEGAKMLFGAGRVAKASICTYHHPSHAGEFTKLLEGYGYEVTPAPGFIPHWKPPHLLTGVIWARKSPES